jgi:hypothetical protein
MKRSLGAILLGLVSASSAFAQDGLTPTDVLEWGQVTLTGRLQFAAGHGDSTTGAIERDLDLTQFDALFAGAVGLGFGFEVEASVPYRFIGDTEIDGTNFEQDFEEVGFGDLTVSPVFRLLKDGEDGAQVIVAALLVAPTGKTEPAEPETRVGPLTFDGEEGGIGDAVWRYGVLAGIGKRLGIVEPYLTVSWISGGEGEVQSDSIDVERPDVWTVTFGSEFHAGGQLTLDLRGAVRILDEEIETDQTGAETVEEAHFTHSWQGQVYFTAGSGVTLILGVGVSFIEDHTVDEAANRDVEGLFVWGASVGVHIVLGR